MKKTITITFLMMVLLFACSKMIPKSSISKVEIATGYCHGECPFTATRIDSSLNVEYYGGEYADKKGFYKGHVKKDNWNDLTTLLDSINYQKLNSRYQQTVDDQVLELIIISNGKSKRIIAQSGSLPKSIAMVFYRIAKTYKKLILKKVDDTIRFNTIVQ